MDTKKLQLVLRIGFSGHRDLGALSPENLQSKIASHIETVWEAARSAAREHQAYFESEPTIEFITGLAQGSDQCAARAALDARCRLIAVSPFQWEEFLRDFVDDGAAATAAKELWEAAYETRIELNGELERSTRSVEAMFEEGRAGYSALGQFVLGHADLMIAFFDSTRTRGGDGGTSWVVERAESQGIPYLILDPQHPDDADATVQALVEEALRDVLPPEASGGKTPHPPDGKSRGILKAWTALGRAFGGHKSHAAHGISDLTTFLGDYVAEREAEKRWWLGRKFSAFFGVLIARLGGRKLPRPQWMAETGPPVTTDRLDQEFTKSDRLAIYFNGLYRSTYASLYLLGFLAVVMAVVGNILGHGEHPTTWPAFLEIGCLFTIMALYAISRVCRWKDRGTDYRLLAEILRAGIHIFPLRTRLGMARQGAFPSQGSVGQSWMAWFGQSILKGEGLPSRRFDAATTELCAHQIHSDLLADQIHYHQQAAAQYQRLERRLGLCSLLLFGSAVLGCISHLIPHGILPESLLHWALILTAAFPALAAALHAVATQAEFSRLERRYLAMAGYLAQFKESMEASVPKDRTENQPPTLLSNPSRDQLVAIANEATSRLIEEVAQWRSMQAIHDVKLP